MAEVARLDLDPLIHDAVASQIDINKLNGIEDAATADQTATEIEGLYESIADTNKFRDAEKTKVGHITVTADVNLDTLKSETDSNNTKETNVTTNLSITKTSTTNTIVSSDGTDAEISVANANDAGLLSASDYTRLSNTESSTQLDNRDIVNRNTDNHTDGSVNGVYTLTERTKLSSVETNAKDDQTGAEIKALYEAEGNTNGYTDSEKTLVDVGTVLNTSASTLPQAINELKNSSAISVAANGNLSSITVQSALEELQTDIDTLNTKLDNGDW